MPILVSLATTDDEIEMALADKRGTQFDLVVFHPSYEYEQFIGGIAPAIADEDKKGISSGTTDQDQVLNLLRNLGTLGMFRSMTYRSKPGIFLELCLAAQQRHDPVVLIIDEINRGNLSKLLGELIYALEYRGERLADGKETNVVRLPFEYGGSDKLFVPKNLYIIATMNSSDQSIGHIDAAIRRRFPQIMVGPDRQAVIENWKGVQQTERGERLADLMRDLNTELANGELGNEIGVGHSYFLCDSTLQEDGGQVKVRRQVRRKWEYQVLPLLKQYQHVTSLKQERIENYYTGRLQDILPSE